MVTCSCRMSSGSSLLGRGHTANFTHCPIHPGSAQEATTLNQYTTFHDTAHSRPQSCRRLQVIGWQLSGDWRQCQTIELLQFTSDGQQQEGHYFGHGQFGLCNSVPEASTGTGRCSCFLLSTMSWWQVYHVIAKEQQRLYRQWTIGNQIDKAHWRDTFSTIRNSNPRHHYNNCNNGTKQLVTAKHATTPSNHDK